MAEINALCLVCGNYSCVCSVATSASGTSGPATRLPQAQEAADTYPKPAHGWTCFHCGETFKTVGGAKAHFGADAEAEPGCILRVKFGGERGLLMALRDREEQLLRYRQEDTELVRQLYVMQSKQSTALNDAEEAGYARGLNDGRATSGSVPPSPPPTPDLAEENRRLRALLDEAATFLRDGYIAGKVYFDTEHQFLLVSRIRTALGDKQ